MLRDMKIANWKDGLQEYDFEIKYKKGEENLVADCLSRCVSSAAVYAYAVDVAWPSNVQK